jgi:hypothetical protein
VLKQPIAQTPCSNAGLGSNNTAAATQQKNKAGLRRKYVFQRKLNGMRLQGYKLAIRTRENDMTSVAQQCSSSDTLVHE